MVDIIGKSFGRYNILEQLGKGGMATVYKAYDTRLEREVAVKVIRIDEFAPSILERILLRFEREAKALAKLTHPNIVHVLDYGEQDGVPYLVMDYLAGGTLKDRLGAPIPWREAVRMLIPVADALAFAHERGILHRDVKPSNILLTEKGQPLLSDFGIAKIIDEESVIDLTGTSTTVGTPEYMAPEQVTSKDVDQRADMYALGVVFYEMITGRKPFKADTPMAVLFKHASDPLPPPGQYIDGLPGAVEDVLYRALAKKPDDRYPNMVAFEKSLEELLETTAVGTADKQAVIETATFQPGELHSALGTAAAEKEVTPPPVTPVPQAKTAGTPPPEMPAWLSTPAVVPQKRAASKGWLVWLLGIILLCGLLTVAGLVGGGYGMQGKGPLAFLASDTPTFTLTSIPTRAPTQTATVAVGTGTILDTWDLYYDWGCEGQFSGPATITFYSDLTYDLYEDTSASLYGTWVTYGTTIDFIFDEAPNSHYVGTFYSDGYMEGTMDNIEGSSGCWYATAWDISLEPISGLAGRWQDQYETTIHTIEWNGLTYFVTDSTHPERGTYEILEQEWNGVSLLWTYRVPDGADVTLEALSVDGDELFLNWWSTNGNSGTDTFLRVP